MGPTTAGPVFNISASTNTAITGSSNDGIGVHGDGATWGVEGHVIRIDGTGSGVHGVGDTFGTLGGIAARGVIGESYNNDGVFGISGKNGVHGYSSSANDSGVWGDNIAGSGVTGSTSAAGQNIAGVLGKTTAPNGTAIVAIADAPTSNGIYARGTLNAGVFDGNVFVNGTASVTVLEIRGADVAEPFDIAESELPKGTVVVIDGERLGGLKRSTKAYDKRVAGIVSGANGVRSGIIMSQPGVNEGGQNVALSGRACMCRPMPRTAQSNQATCLLPQIVPAPR